MDRLDAMSVLVAVVEAGSLSAASRRLGTPTRDRQPQGLRAGRAPDEPASEQVVASDDADGRGPILCRGVQAHHRRR